MQGEKPIIELLNAALTLQLTAINQYFLPNYLQSAM